MGIEESVQEFHPSSDRGDNAGRQLWVTVQDFERFNSHVNFMSYYLLKTDKIRFIFKIELHFIFSIFISETKLSSEYGNTQ